MTLWLLSGSDWLPLPRTQVLPSPSAGTNGWALLTLYRLSAEVNPAAWCGVNSDIFHTALLAEIKINKTQRCALEGYRNIPPMYTCTLLIHVLFTVFTQLCLYCKKKYIYIFWNYACLFMTWGKYYLCQRSYWLVLPN